MIKKSSVKTAPKGKIPPIIEVKTGLMYHGCNGISLGIPFVRTGTSRADFRYPMYAPKNTRGTEMPNQSTSRANMVAKGTDPALAWPQMSKFRKKKMPKQPPGKSKAVINVAIFQSGPSQNL